MAGQHCLCPKDGSHLCAWCTAALAREVRPRVEPVLYNMTIVGQPPAPAPGPPPGGRTREGPPAGLGLLPPGGCMGTRLPLRIVSEKNTHEHWAPKARRVKTQRQYVYEKLSSLWDDGPLLGLPLVITIIRIAPRLLDDDNLAFACSAVRDGVSDFLAGHYCKGQDRQEGLLWKYDQQYIAPKFWAVEIRVERPKA